MKCETIFEKNYEGIAIKVENISKCYRIGLREKVEDTLARSLVSFLLHPMKRYRKYRSLYKFDDVYSQSELDSLNNSPDIIWALNGVKFEVRQGEVIGIIGRNGVGKTTLLKILSKITNPTGGRAIIRGRVSSLLEVGTGFHPELTGRENIYLNGAILGMNKREMDDKFNTIVDFSGVEKFLDTPLKRYSSGMKIRLAFSVAAHLEPDILIVDEVLAVGDAEFQKKCLNTMQRVGREGRTVLFVSHNMPAVTRLCERAILLDNGRVVEDGPSVHVVSKYLTRDTGTTASREWPVSEDAPGGPFSRLRGVRVRGADGTVTDSIDIRQQFSVEMDFDVIKNERIMLPHFGLYNDNGDCIFLTVDQDPSWRKRARPKGHYVSNVIIPGNLLAEGMVFVNCYLLTLNPDEVQFAESSVVAFTVYDRLEGDSARGDYAKNMLGIVRPLLEWNTQYNANT